MAFLGIYLPVLCTLAVLYSYLIAPVTATPRFISLARLRPAPSQFPCHSEVSVAGDCRTNVANSTAGVVGIYQTLDLHLMPPYAFLQRSRRPTDVRKGARSRLPLLLADDAQ